MIDRDATPRLGLPYLAAGQAQKEWTHNEALALIDLAVQPVAYGISNDPPEQAAPGESWIVGTAPTGAWADQAGAIAGWSDGGWRFLSLPVGSELRLRSGERLLRTAHGWVGPGRVGDPDDGEVRDVQARETLVALIEIMRHQGLIAR